MEIAYAVEPNLTAEEFIDVLHRSGLASRRPVDQMQTIAGMLRQASSLVTARLGGEIVGVSRAVSDFSYCTYLSDLAVDVRFQRKGIGKRLITRTHQHCGLQTRLILLAAPAATEYYPHIGFEQHPSCWTIAPRTPLEAVPEGLSSATPPKKSGLTSEQPHQLDSFFDSIAAEYDEAIHRCFARYPEMLDTLVTYIPNSLQPKRIVDLGCGSGNLAEKLSVRFSDAELNLVDLSGELLKAAERRLHGRSDCYYYPENMLQVEFESGSVDLIVSTIAIHHLTPDEKSHLFVKCRQWLRPDGVFLVADQCAAATDELTRQHHEGWKSLSKRAGASAEEWEAWKQHERQHDYHESVAALQAKLQEAGFPTTDVIWRYLLWSILFATPAKAS